MKRALIYLPTAVVLAAIAALLSLGPIAQAQSYHNFADYRTWSGLHNAADVLSNIGFLLVGLWGMIRLRNHAQHPDLRAGWPGYRLFLIALMLTAAGSAYYHLAPDNPRLVWDRLPIALACVGLLAGVRAESHPSITGNGGVIWLSIAAVLSIVWWVASGPDGYGDLRPYLLLQMLPLILIPLWQWIYSAPRGDRLAFGAAILLYVGAKAAEMNDQHILSLTGWISGHTMKHLISTLAAATLVARLVQRTRETRCHSSLAPSIPNS